MERANNIQSKNEGNSDVEPVRALLVRNTMPIIRETWIMFLGTTSIRPKLL